MRLMKSTDKISPSRKYNSFISKTVTISKSVYNLSTQFIIKKCQIVKSEASLPVSCMLRCCTLLSLKL